MGMHAVLRRLAFGLACTAPCAALVQAHASGDATTSQRMPAAQAERLGGHSGARMHYRAAHDPMQSIRQRLDRLQADLHLKPEQLAAWDALRNRITAQAQSALERMRNRAPVGRLPDEALRERAARLREMAEALDDTAGLMKALVDQLSPEQRTILRLHQQCQHRRMHAMHRGEGPRAWGVDPGYAPLSGVYGDYAAVTVLSEFPAALLLGGQPLAGAFGTAAAEVPVDAPGGARGAAAGGAAREAPGEAAVDAPAVASGDPRIVSR